MGRLATLKPTMATIGSRLKPPPKVTESFYRSAEWRALVAGIKRERGAYCEVCGSAKGLIADHVKERRDGGADLDPRNVQLLCGAHHNRKTAREREARAKGQR